MTTYSFTVPGSTYFVRNWKTGAYTNGPTVRMLRYFRSDRPVTVKRVKPSGVVALFENGTSRTAEQWIQQNCTIENRLGNYDYQYQMDQVTSLGPDLTAGNKIYGASNVNAIKSQILSSARDQGVNLAQMWGEYRETAAFAKTVLTSVAKLTIDLINRDPKMLKRLIEYFRLGMKPPRKNKPRWFDHVSSTYLQYVFAVKPLVMDLEEVVEALVNHKQPPPLRAFVRGRVNSSAIVTSTFNSIPSGLATGTRMSVRLKRERGVALVWFNDSLLEQSLGTYGFTNALSVVWELTPLSWMLDYFISVGEFLASLDNALAIRSAKWVYSYTYYENIHAELLGNATVCKYKKTYREAPASLSLLAPIYYKQSLSAQHLLNSVAVLTQLRKKFS